MKTLLLIHEEDMYESIILCPFCKEIIEEGCFSWEDHVADNCSLWCCNCGDMLICPSSNGDNGNFDLMEKGELINDGCTTLLTDKQFIKDYLAANNIVIKDSFDKYHAYQVGILKILQASHSPLPGQDFAEESYQDEDEDQDIDPIHNLDIIRFYDAPTGTDLRHDGVFLYYSAKCTECDKNYKSYIWGD